MDHLRPSVLITGSSTGIGRACAVRFGQLGYRVLAGVRNTGDAGELNAVSNGRVEPWLLDVTDPRAVAAAVVALGDAPLDALVNNAGVAVAGPLELVPVESWRLQLEINVIGLVSVTQAFLPALRRARGRIVNIGSIAGRSAVPCSGPYCASKYAVEGITDALRMEMAPFGVSVSVIEPGAVDTPIWDKTAHHAAAIGEGVDPAVYSLYSGLVEKIGRLASHAARNAIPVEEVVRAVEHAVTSPRPRTRYPVGRDARLRLLLNHLPDRLIDRLILNRIAAL